MLVLDTVTLGDQRRTTKDGYLVIDAKVARTGIQIYSGAEVGKPDMATVRVYRSPDEVFSDEARASFAHKPVTINHPAEAVNSGNWARYAKGYTGDTVQKDGDYLRVPFALMDAEAIRAVDGGKRQLSNGYSCDLEWTAGVTPAGEAYDASQRNIRGNHLAIVDAARAGPACRIGDSFASALEEDSPMADLTTVVVGDSAVQIAAADAIKLEAFKASMNTKLSDAETKHQTAIAAKDADLATKDAQIDALKAKVLDDAAVDARVQARGDLIAKAKAIAPTVDTAGKADADIRRAVVVAKLGDAAVKDKPAAYIDARFDILAEDVKPADPLRQVIAGGLQAHDANSLIAQRDKAMADRLNRYSTAYLGQPADKSAA